METVGGNEFITEDMREAFRGALREDREERRLLLEKYPPEPPNKVCYHAFLRGISIENSFCPRVKELNPFFEVPNEKVYIWTYEKNKNSAVISEVLTSIKEQPFWKNIGSILQLAFAFWYSFEHVGSTDELDYKWIYYFETVSTNIDEAVFYNLDSLEKHSMSQGRIVKATDISSMAHIIEILVRDDKAFTSLALLNASFNLSYCCLHCELSEHPWHDHLTNEPQIWEQASLLPQMEAAIVQACRCVEGILGEPPNRGKQGKVFAYKERFKSILGINADDTFIKAGKTYLDFYYDLFFDLRNPSAHSYGNVHFDLERKKVIQAQCFADIILGKYFEKNILEQEEALKILKFNNELLNRVDKCMSTSRTK
ncbi:MAG: hypothetical protein ACRDDX_16445 [Cellulosilyticaceae bacterium]